MSRAASRWAPVPETPFDHVEVERMYHRYRHDVADRMRLLWDDIARRCNKTGKNELSVEEICACTRKEKRSALELLNKLVECKALVIVIGEDHVARYSSPVAQRIISKMAGAATSSRKRSCSAAREKNESKLISRPEALNTTENERYTDLDRNVSEDLSAKDYDGETDESVAAAVRKQFGKSSQDDADWLQTTECATYKFPLPTCQQNFIKMRLRDLGVCGKKPHEFRVLWDAAMGRHDVLQQAFGIAADAHQRHGLKNPAGYVHKTAMRMNGLIEC